MPKSLHLIVAMTGASGVVYGKRFLEVLKENAVETHLIVSEDSEKVIKQELDIGLKYLAKLATYVYNVNDLGASVSSGSFKTDGMAIIPCTMKTLAGVASGYSDNLILRAADVTIKEGRKLVVVPRETPLSVIHLSNMLKMAKIGVAIIPAMPSFYNKPKHIEELVDYIVGKVLDQFSIEHQLFKRWKGL